MKQSSYTECFSERALFLSWERVLASVGADAKDFFGINLFKGDLEKSLSDLRLRIQAKEYIPKRAFKYFEPKKNGTQRTKTVLGIQDALIYQAISNHIGEIYFDQLKETDKSVFGSLLHEDVNKGVSLLDEDPDSFYFFEFYVAPYNRFINSINETIESGGVTHILETDITGFFDTIPHSVLTLILKEKGIDNSILELLSTCLNIWSGTRDSMTIGVGIPQGPAGSFLLANIVLDSMDRIAMKDGLHYYRFMDDIRIYGKSKQELLDSLVKLDRHLKGKSLCLNSQKTSISLISEHDSDKENFLDDYGIEVEAKEKATPKEILEKDILEQDSTQETIDPSKEEILLESDFLPLYEHALEGVEKKLNKFYKKHKNKEEDDIETSDMREFLTLSQKWRTIIKVLKEEQASFFPNKQLVPIWQFGITMFYWKSNNFAWNLLLYDDLSEYYESFVDLLKRFERYEWVQYQIISVFIPVLQKNTSQFQEILQLIPKTESPLVRLGYFSVLISTIKEDSKFFQSVAELIKHEEDSYVKNSILNSISKKNLNIPLEILKSWFV